jgi:hypothetical protein
VFVLRRRDLVGIRKRRQRIAVHRSASQRIASHSTHIILNEPGLLPEAPGKTIHKCLGD